MKSLCFLVLFTFFNTKMAAQTFLQGGGYIGGINYAGDLAPSSFVGSFAETHLDYGVFLRIRPTDWLAVKLNYHHGKLSGSDVNALSDGRRLRNLHFRSPLDELSVSGVLFLPNDEKKKWMIRPFFALGVGIFHFNPQAELNGVWHNLQPLSTEGQGLSRMPDRKPYALTQVCFPIGAGFQWAITKRMQLEVDVSMRKTLTDYLDDVSTTYVPLEWLTAERGAVAAALSNQILSKNGLQTSQNQGLRGDPTRKDWYMIASLGLTINLLGSDRKHNFFVRKTDYMNCRQLFWKKRKR
jgi:Domain of unknown function (DUF6089)